MKKLTIGITTYNNYPFIYNLIYEIESQINNNRQLLDDIDFILFDDCSTNSSFIKEVPSYINVIKSEQNTGTPANGRNHIIEKAHSKYVLFVDGDDVIVTDLVDLINEVSTKNEDILFSEVIKIGADGQHIKSPFIYTDALFHPQTKMENKQKICVHQTGIWSIYKVDFLKKNNIKYNVDIRYEDNLFLYTILVNNPLIGCVQPYYGWRTNVKSFSYSSESIKQRIMIYKKTLELLVENMNSDFAPYILYSIWNQTYSNIIRDYPRLSIANTKSFFNELEAISKTYETEISLLKSKADPQVTDRYFKYSQYKILKGHRKIIFLKYFNKVKKSKSKIKKRIVKLLMLLPMNNNKIFMVSQYGKYTSNPRYLFDELKKDKKNKISYFVKDKSLLNKNGFKDYNNKLKFYYEFYTAKTIYFDTWLDPDLAKRENQKWIQMWHGYPYKKIYTDIEIYDQVNGQEKHLKKMNNISKWDVIHSLDSNNTRIFQNLFPNVNVLEYEYPRIKWLKENKNNSKLKKEIKNKYNLNENTKYTLFAPTYRPYKVYFDNNHINSLVADDNELIYHPHPMLNTSYKFDGKIMNNIEIQELLLVVDELITDYSSIKYDFKQINNDHKIKEYTPDKKLYERVHGLY